MVDIALTVALLYRAPAGWLSAKQYLLEFLLSSFSSIYILVGAEFSPTSLNHDHSVNCLFDFFVCMRAIEREHVRFVKELHGIWYGVRTRPMQGVVKVWACFE